MSNRTITETPAQARERILEEAQSRWQQLSSTIQELSLYNAKESAADSQYIVNGGHDFRFER